VEEPHIKFFDSWNNFKKILETIDFDIPFFEGEIWSAAIGINIDIEIDGKGKNFERPVVIVKKFSKKHAWVVPVSRVVDVKDGIHIRIVNDNLEINSTALIPQLQRISSRRFLYRLGKLNIEQFLAIRREIAKHLGFI
jgi:mRNA interferase MazF